MNRANSEGAIIRNERAEDESAVRSVIEAAFGRPAEAGLVEMLRAGGAVLMSLIAECDERIVGHVLFSRIWIETAQGSVDAVGLAPVAVLPEYQRRGIGGGLINAGLESLRKAERIVLVLGRPDYYRRFGFSIDKAQTIKSSFPAESFMAMELRPGALDGIHGTAKYPPAFGL